MADSKMMKQLKQVVRRLGGEGAFQRSEHVRAEIAPTFAEMLLTEASASGPPTLVLTDAPGSGCHDSSMKYVMSIGGELWSGFALNDGVWRLHSWVVQDGVVVEATPVTRERYVGIPINTPERAAAWLPPTRSRMRTPEEGRIRRK